MTSTQLGAMMQRPDILKIAVKHGLPMISTRRDGAWAYAEQVLAFADELLSASKPAEGWKLVPIEPTEEMVKAESNSGGLGLNFHEWMGRITIAWRHMLAASPAAPAQSGEPVDEYPETPESNQAARIGVLQFHLQRIVLAYEAGEKARFPLSQVIEGVRDFLQDNGWKRDSVKLFAAPQPTQPAKADLDRIASILAEEIECGVFEKHVAPALNVARKVFSGD